MKTSTERILTTHTGSLPRPKPLIDVILGRERAGTVDAQRYETETAKAVEEVVALQVAAGIDVVSDGEMSKPSYTTYIRHRVDGIAPDPRAAAKGRDIMIGRDLLAHHTQHFRYTIRNSSRRRIQSRLIRRTRYGQSIAANKHARTDHLTAID